MHCSPKHDQSIRRLPGRHRRIRLLQPMNKSDAIQQRRLFHRFPQSSPELSATQIIAGQFNRAAGTLGAMSSPSHEVQRCSAASAPPGSDGRFPPASPPARPSTAPRRSSSCRDRERVQRHVHFVILRQMLARRRLRAGSRILSSAIPPAANCSRTRTRSTSSARFRFFSSSRDCGTCRRISVHSSIICRVIFIMPLKHPKVTMPVLRDGVSPASGAPVGG